MDENVDLQAVTIGLGTVVAMVALVYGIVVSRTVAGVDTTTVAAWVFAVTFVAVGVLHVFAGRSDIAVAYLTGAFGWLLVLLGPNVPVVGFGFLLLVAGGIYIVRTSLGERKDGDA